MRVDVGPRMTLSSTFKLRLRHMICPREALEVYFYLHLFPICFVSSLYEQFPPTQYIGTKLRPSIKFNGIDQNSYESSHKMGVKTYIKVTYQTSQSQTFASPEQR